jgi:hypothetical protein
MGSGMEMQAVVDAVARYFRAATDDDRHNTAIARDDLQRHGEVLVPMGLVYMADSLQKAARETMAMFVLDEAAGDAYVVDQGDEMTKKLKSLIRAFGETGVAALLKTLQFSDEDTVGLAACMLADKQFVRPSSVAPLRTALGRAYGSACKLALALALYRHGDVEWFERLGPQFLIRLPGKDSQALEGAARSVFPVLVLDIVSNGQAYSGPGRSQWTRKQY